MEVLGADVTMQDAFKAANEVLHGAVAGIAEIITLPGMINVDFADVRTVMSETGIAMMGSGSASGVDRAKIAAEQAVACPLLENIDLNNARGVLVNVSGAASKLKLGEIHEVMDTVSEFLADDATTIVGSVFDEEMGDSIRVTIVATGLGNAVNRAQPKAFTVVKTGTDNSPVEMVAHGAGAAAGVNYGELDVPVVFRRKTRDASATVEALKQSGLEMYDIPAFLRKQAD
jgi:cell division protein FtsZ